jgi:hypothetical protein
MLFSCVMGIGGDLGEMFRVDELPSSALNSHQSQTAKVSGRLLLCRGGMVSR